MVIFPDSGVLIAAARGSGLLGQLAHRALDNAQRIMASSSFIWLEVMPKALYHQRTFEADYYERFFRQVDRWADEYRILIQQAQSLAEQYGLGGMDALHVASAKQTNCDILITTEQTGKPLHRVKGLRVVSLFDL